MPIPTVPTILEIKTRINADVEGTINDTTPALPKGFVKSLAGSLAGKFVLLNLAILWVYKQIFPQTADYPALVLMGVRFAIVPKKKQTATILCTVAGTGAMVPKGTTYVGTNSIIYKVTTSTIITDGIAPDVPMQAQTAGDVGNLADSEILSICQTNLALSGTATVTSTQTSGADAESKESFRARVIARYRRRATGGSPFDYYLWGIECANFIWVGPYNDEIITNKIILFGKVDNQTDGIPTSSQLLELDDCCKKDPTTWIADRKPMGDLLETRAITIHEFDLAIEIKNTNGDIETSVTTAASDYIASFKPYIEGVSFKENNLMTRSNVSNVCSDTAEIYGATIVSVEITDVETGELIVDNKYTLLGGEFPKVRNVDYQEVA